MTLANQILRFNSELKLMEPLPDGIRAMNPFKGPGSDQINAFCELFYQKFYDDQKKRKLILGINPGRLGAGLTGIPFTDTKRLTADCGIATGDLHSHEPSSVFVYEVIHAYGGVEAFYSDFFINSVCPLGFVISNEKGREVNYNYYDQKNLQQAVLPFIKRSIDQMVALGMETEKVYCLGTGKNFKFLNAFNQQHGWFGQVIPLEHPRYVMQYKSKLKDQYIDKFLSLLS